MPDAQTYGSRGQADLRVGNPGYTVTKSEGFRSLKVLEFKKWGLEPSSLIEHYAHDHVANASETVPVTVSLPFRPLPVAVWHADQWVRLPALDFL